VEAFLSHSWHDDSAEKWTLLQEWREEFKRQMGREPRLWIDNLAAVWVVVVVVAMVL
jgi:hypothetical protein